MGCRRKKNIFSRNESVGAGVWLLHILSAILVFIWGIRFAIRRAPLSIVGYRLFKMLLKHR